MQEKCTGETQLTNIIKMPITVKKKKIYFIHLTLKRKNYAFYYLCLSLIAAS